MFSIFDCHTRERVSEETYALFEEASHDYHMNQGDTYIGEVLAHTPGPWQLDTTQKYYAPCIRHNGFIVALLADNTKGLVREYDRQKHAKEDAANALLLSAAPDLLEACLKLAAWDQSNDDAVLLSEACSFARAAIAKVQGRL